MHNKIKEHFTGCSQNSCIVEVSELEFHVLDIKNCKCKIANEEEKSSSNFRVSNPNKKAINFLVIDKCVFVDSEHKKCDFAIFDNCCFCFVEIKDTRTRSTEGKRQGVNQLKVTIQKFKEKIAYENYSLEAIIAWKYKSKRPAIATQMQSSKLEFVQKFNAKLLEGNEKTFL